MEGNKKMKTEIEGKFLDINKEELRKKLVLFKAELVHKERLMKRMNFDYEDHRLEKIGGWVRVRDEGDKISLAYKQLNDRTLHGTKEISLIINDFEDACTFLKSIGLRKISYQETKRESWLLDNVGITIDTWPWIPPFVELEGETEESLKVVCKKLGLNWNDVMHGSVETAYQSHFNVSESEIDNVESITFIPTPNWLEERRKK